MSQIDLNEEPLTVYSLTCIYFWRALVVFTLTIVANFLPGLNHMLIFIGAVFGTFIVYVNPILLYNKAYEVKEDEPDPRRGVKTLGWINMSIGIALGLYSLGFFIYSITMHLDIE